MSDFPPKLSGTHPLVPWLNKLRDAAAYGRITSFINGRFTSGPSGTQLIAKTGPPQSGAVVYVKACLDGGTECFIPVVIMGPIYRTNGGTTSAPTITESDVPDGAKVLQ